MMSALEGGTHKWQLKGTQPCESCVKVSMKNPCGSHTYMPIHITESFMMLRLSCVKYAQPTLVDHTCNDTVSSLTNEQLFSALAF